ncbi:PAS domain S-box protein [candidate division KSB1 bacterium]|nr:PAS domain S-box protein [candidate division KSB1 bacterium]
MKNSEQEFPNSLLDWEEIFQAIGHPTFILQPDHGIIAANKAAIQAAGLPEKKLIGKQCHDIMHNANKPPANCPMLKMHQTEHVETASMEVEALDGEYLVSCTPVFDADGQIEKVIHIATNITDRKEAEDKLKESEKKYRTLVNESPDGIFVADLSGRFIDVNNSMCRELKYSEKELLNMSIFDLIPKQSIEIFENRLKDIVSGKTLAQPQEYSVTAKDGTQFIIEIRSVPFLREGKVIGFQGIARDITEQKHMELALVKSENWYHVLFDSGIDAKFVHGIDQNGLPGKLIDANVVACQRLGYTKEELLKMSPKDFDDETEAQHVTQIMKKLVKEKSALFEMTHVTKDGRKIPTEISAHLIEIGGQQVVLSIARDITERKKAEEVLRTREAKLQSIFRAAPTGIGVVVNRVFTELNDRFCEMVGYRREELLGTNAAMVYPSQEEYEYVGKVKYEQIKEKGTGTVETRFKRKDGQIIDVLLSSTPLDIKNLSAGTTFTALNITERKQAEKALQDSLTRSTALFEHAAVPIWEEDFSEVKKHIDQIKKQGIEDFETYFHEHPKEIQHISSIVKVRDVNQKSLEFYNARNKTELNKFLPDWFMEESLEVFRSEIIALAKGADRYECEIPVRTPQGDVKHLQVNLAILPDHNEPWDRVFISFIDITDRKKAEEALKRRAQELTAFNVLSQRVSSTLSIKQVTNEAIRSVADAVNPDLVLLFLRDKDNLNLIGFGPEKSEYVHKETPIHRVGECLCGLAISKEMPMYSKNIHEDARCTWEECKLAGLHSYAALPLRSGDELIGVLGLASVDERDFSLQASFIETLANELAVGLQNALLFEQVNSRLQELSALLTINRTLAVTLDKQTVLQTIIDSATSLYNLGSGAIYLMEKDGLYLGATTPSIPGDFPEEFMRAELKDHPHIKRCITKKGHVLVPDAETADFTPAERAVSETRNLRSILYLPMQIEKRVTGVLILASVGETRKFVESEINLYQALSSQAALAIENARLFETSQQQTEALKQRFTELKQADLELQGYTKRLEIQHEIERELLVSQTSEAVARIIVENLIKLIPYFACSISIFDFETKNVEVSALNYNGKIMTRKKSQFSMNDFGDIKKFKQGDILRVKNIGKLPTTTRFEKSILTDGIYSYIVIPLVAHGNLSGILYIGRTKLRFFTTKEVEIARDAANQAAVAIHQASLYEQIKRYTTELEQRVQERTEALKQSEEKMKAQYKGIPVPTYTWQWKKNDLILTDYNDAAFEISQGGIKKFIGKTAKEMYHDNRDILNDINLCFKNKTTIEREMPYLFKTIGEIKYLAVKYAFVAPDNVLVHTEDITERKRAEENLKEANQRLQEADRLKSVFLASMSHELRTPLNSIIGFTGIMLMGMSGELKQEQKKQLLMVKNSANHLLSLLNDLLDISKIEAGKVQLSKEKFNFFELLADVLETFKLYAEEKKLDIKTQVGRNIILDSDKRRMQQILTNLVSNAIKFTEQGCVRISTNIRKDNKLTIKVSDTGIGIKNEDMSRLFSPFQQLDVSMTKKHAGTGLGLYLCKNLCTLLGGTISVKSEIGKGSVFTVELPVD